MAGRLAGELRLWLSCRRFYVLHCHAGRIIIFPRVACRAGLGKFEESKTKCNSSTGKSALTKDQKGYNRAPTGKFAVVDLTNDPDTMAMIRFLATVTSNGDTEGSSVSGFDGHVGDDTDGHDGDDTDGHDGGESHGHDGGEDEDSAAYLDLNSVSKSEIQTQLKKRKLTITGTKSHLVGVLRAAVGRSVIDVSQLSTKETRLQLKRLKLDSKGLQCRVRRRLRRYLLGMYNEGSDPKNGIQAAVQVQKNLLLHLAHIESGTSALPVKLHSFLRSLKTRKFEDVVREIAEQFSVQTFLKIRGMNGTYTQLKASKVTKIGKSCITNNNGFYYVSVDRTVWMCSELSSRARESHASCLIRALRVIQPGYVYSRAKMVLDALCLFMEDFRPSVTNLPYTAGYINR
jgi:hypothetical protein